MYLYANLWPNENLHFKLLVKKKYPTSLICVILQEPWYHIFFVDIFTYLLHWSICSIKWISVVIVTWVLKVANKSRLPWYFNHRITKCLRLEGTSRDPTPLPSRITCSMLHRNTFTLVLNISRERDPSTSLGNVCQCSVILTVKKFFLLFSQTSCVSVCAQSPLSCHRVPLKRFHPHPLDILPSGI